MIVACLAVLAGCSSSSQQAAGFGCPRVLVVPEAQEATLFRPGGGRDVTDIVSRARIADFRGRCSYEPGWVAVELDVQLAAERGPSLAAESVPFTYFVAVTEGNSQQVLARAQYDVEFRFGNQPAITLTEPLSQRIPLPSGVDGRTKDILLGMVLTREQLEFNRQGARRF